MIIISKCHLNFCSLAAKSSLRRIRLLAIKKREAKNTENEETKAKISIELTIENIISAPPFTLIIFLLN